MYRKMKLAGLGKALCAVVLVLALTGCPPEVIQDPKVMGREEVEELKTLVGTVWELNTLKLTFESETLMRTNESLTARYAYTYEPETRAGEIETLGAFTVSEDFLTMTFTRYNGAISDAVFENSGAAIAGALWVWEQSVLQFGPIKASLNGALYPYSFDSATRTGTIEKIGQFTLAEDSASITVTQFRRAAYDLVFEKASAKPPWTGSLIGTSWGWQNGFNGWMVFEFMNETEVILIFTESTYHSDTPEVYAYTYNRQSQSGNIPTQGPFTLTNGNKVLWFSQWRAYPHGAEYTRIE